MHLHFPLLGTGLNTVTFFVGPSEMHSLPLAVSLWTLRKKILGFITANLENIFNLSKSQTHCS